MATHFLDLLRQGADCGETFIFNFYSTKSDESGEIQASSRVNQRAHWIYHEGNRGGDQARAIAKLHGAFPDRLVIAFYCSKDADGKIAKIDGNSLPALWIYKSTSYDQSTGKVTSEYQFLEAPFGIDVQKTTEFVDEVNYSIKESSEIWRRLSVKNSWLHANCVSWNDMTQFFVSR